MDCESTPELAPAPAVSGVGWGTRARLPALHEVVRVVWLGSLVFGSAAGAGGRDSSSLNLDGRSVSKGWVSSQWGIPLAPPDMPDERLDVVPDHCLRTSARAEKHAWPLAVPITGWVAAPAAGLNAAAGEVVVLRGYPTHA